MNSQLEITLDNLCTEKKLLDYGFVKKGSTYILNKPLHYYKSYPEISLIVQATLSEERVIDYEVQDSNGIYTSFYNPEYPGKKNNLVLQKVIRKVKKEFKEMVEDNILCDVKYERVKTNGRSKKWR